ncbi:ent-kaurenoic acid oxidase 1-like [Amaranthus tricolor]|uniref:ent-kaurenoic acid oxidase 1-like n=1 Tax=Amaranthus tricolor TaxID=29722 RepID=UPI002588E04F|nr:ent-kaurenoic acid oxidase 1-like [Amaranthus tricolor]
MEQMWMITMVLGLLPVLGWLIWWWNEIWYVWPILARLKRSNSDESAVQLPPGYLGLPFLGETLSFQWFFNIVRRPDDFIKSKIERYGNNVGVYRTHLYGAPSIIVCASSLCKHILNSGDNFKAEWPTNKVVGRNSVISIEGERHDIIKSLVVNCFSRPDALAWVMHKVQPCIVSALESWSQKSNIKTFYELKKATLDCTLRYVVGFEFNTHQIEDLAEAYEILNLGFRATPLHIPGTSYYKALKCREKIVKIFKNELDKRRTNNKDIDVTKESVGDLMDSLMKATDIEGKHLKDEEVLDNIVNSILLGHISSAYAVTWCHYFLAKSPTVLQKLREENRALLEEKNGEKITNGDIQKLKYTNKVVEEVLRMANLSGFLFRRVMEDAEFKGYLIPKGWRVMVWLRQLHNDPNNFDDPMCFNPDRWDTRPKHGTYLPFGGGLRFCPGSMIIRLIMALFIHHLAIGYKWEMVNPDVPISYLSHPLPADGLEISMTKL